MKGYRYIHQWHFEAPTGKLPIKWHIYQDNGNKKYFCYCDFIQGALVQHFNAHIPNHFFSILLSQITPPKPFIFNIIT